MMKTKPKSLLLSDSESRAASADRLTLVVRPCQWKPREPGLNLGFSGLELGYYCTDVPESGWVLRSRGGWGGSGCWNDRTYPLHQTYSPGDVLAGREAWAETADIDGRRILTYRCGGTRLIVDGPQIAHGEHRCVALVTRWRPASTMPLWAVRHWLRVTEVLPPCRVADVTEDEAMDCGVGNSINSFRSRFRILWQRRYGRRYPWESAWCWRIRVEKERFVLGSAYQWAESGPWSVISNASVETPNNSDTWPKSEGSRDG